MTINPDTKDWTWVLERPCPQCGFEASSATASDLPDLLRDNAQAWLAVVARADVGTRPAPATWSPLEYACHVRDVHEVFGGRYASMLDTDDPLFENWDQDQAALDGDYGTQDAVAVGAALQRAAQDVAVRLDALSPAQWERPGRRSNGSVFTVTSLARYHAHDVVHHLWDVRP